MLQLIILQILIIKIFKKIYRECTKEPYNVLTIDTTLPAPLDWNSPCCGEEASHQEVSTLVHQWEERNWASQLKSSDQQIFSRMSSPDSTLIKQD